LEEAVVPLNAESSGRTIWCHPDEVPSRDDERFCLTVVIDMDETLLTTRGDTVYLRPFAREFLEALQKLMGIELILWSAGLPEHVDRCLKVMDPDESIFQHVIARGSWMMGLPLKRLSDLKRKRVLIVDDNPLASRFNRRTAIVIPEFSCDSLEAHRDMTLYYVLQIIARNIIFGSNGHEPNSVKHPGNLRINQKADWSVADFLTVHPYLKSGPKGSPIGFIRCYLLDVVDQKELIDRIKWFRTSEVPQSPVSSVSSNLTMVGSPVGLAAQLFGGSSEDLSQPLLEDWLIDLPPCESFCFSEPTTVRPIPSRATLVE
jgi:hypothetical protein